MTKLLDDRGAASMATMLMSSHFAFRRDLACFATALAADDPARRDAVRETWTSFRTALHHHHTIEDTAMFPDARAKQPELAAAIDELDAHHRAIDPLLERGDALFADLAQHAPAALALVRALADLLATHLDLEERTLIPQLRAVTVFPEMPADMQVAYAEGFAWSMAGLAPAVCDAMCAMLPAGLVAALPAAREAFDARCRAVWGDVHRGASFHSSASLG